MSLRDMTMGDAIRAAYIAYYVRHHHVPGPSKVLMVAGAIAVSYTAVRVTLSVWRNFKAFVLARYFPRLFGIELKKLGSWAVVTGATDGIGKEFAMQLATRHHLNIVLISRSTDRLKKVAAEIESEAHGEVTVKHVAVDFSQELDIYDKIESELDGLDIAILVNNVGYAGRDDELDYFHQTKRSSNYWDVIRVNSTPVTYMTQIVLPRMVAKKKGVIVNVAAAAGKIDGLPFASVYSGSKAYVIRFTRTLELECHGSGVIFQTVMPFGIATKMIGHKPSLTVVDSETFVRSAIAAIGIQSATGGCLTHNIMFAIMALLKYLPESVFSTLALSASKQLKREKLNKQS